MHKKKNFNATSAVEFQLTYEEILKSHRDRFSWHHFKTNQQLLQFHHSSFYYRRIRLAIYEAHLFTGM